MRQSPHTRRRTAAFWADFDAANPQISDARYTQLAAALGYPDAATLRKKHLNREPVPQWRIALFNALYLGQITTTQAESIVHTSPKSERWKAVERKLADTIQHNKVMRAQRAALGHRAVKQASTEQAEPAVILRSALKDMSTAFTMLTESIDQLLTRMDT